MEAPRSRSLLRRAGSLALLLALGGVAVVVWRIAPALRAARGGAPPVVDRIPPELPAELGPFAILLFSKTSGFRHEAAIPACEASVRRIAEANGWSVFATENAAVFDASQLPRFRVLVSNNATGDNWTAEQKRAFQGWIEGGGGFVGVHGAAGTRFRFWDWYTDVLLRARFTRHPLFPQLQEARVLVEDRAHPATAHLGESFRHEDEWYSFESSPRGPDLRVLASLDESSYRPREILTDIAMGDHPIVWSHCVGRGRVFYSALGHTAESYARPELEQMLAGAIAWAGGLLGGCP